MYTDDVTVHPCNGQITVANLFITTLKYSLPKTLVQNILLDQPSCSVAFAQQSGAFLLLCRYRVLIDYLDTRALRYPVRNRCTSKAARSLLRFCFLSTFAVDDIASSRLVLSMLTSAFVFALERSFFLLLLFLSGSDSSWTDGCVVAVVCARAARKRSNAASIVGSSTSSCATRSALSCNTSAWSWSALWSL